MIILAAFAAGCALGWYRAARRGGNRLDKLQYGAGHGIAFALLALFVILVAARTGVL